MSRYAMGVAFLVLCSGCSVARRAFSDNEVHAKMEVVVPVSPDLGRCPTIGVRAKASVPASPEELQQLRRSIVDELVRSRRFERVVDLSADAAGTVDAVLEFDLVDVRRVSSSDRFWLGAIAGSPLAAGSVTLSSSAEHRILGAAAVAATLESNNVRAGTTEVVLSRAAVEAARFATSFRGADPGPERRGG